MQILDNNEQKSIFPSFPQTVGIKPGIHIYYITLLYNYTDLGQQRTKIIISL